MSKTTYTIAEGCDIMPTIELVEYERTVYIKKMEDYLVKLKGLPTEEAKKKSLQNLIASNILQEDGNFTEIYARCMTQKKNNGK